RGAVALLLIAIFLPAEGSRKASTLKCFSRPPPEVWVVPFNPQPPGKIVNCDAHKSTCIYFRYHGTRVARSFPVHACMPLADLPAKCHHGASFYEPRWHYDHRGTRYEGSIKCCGTDYCNEIEEAMFVPVHFNHDEPSWFKEFLLFPLIITAMLALIFWEHLPDVLYGVRLWLQLEMDKVEDPDAQSSLKMNPNSLPVLPVNEDSETIQYTGPNVSGFFESTTKMMETIHEIEKWRAVDGEREKEIKREDDKRRKRRMSRNREIQINTTICNRQATQHTNTRVFREVPTRLTDLLSRLIEHGPYEFPFDPNELGDLFENAGEILGDEPSMVEVDFDVHVIGNLEGSYIDLFRWFGIYGWPPKAKFVFLGGTIHQSNNYSLEVIAMLLALKVKMPNHVYIIRGYAEGQPLQMGERFPPRVAESLREVASAALTRLPLAVLVNKQMLCIHSSLPNNLISIAELNQVRRPLVRYHRESLEAHLLNAVPDDIFATKLKEMVEKDELDSYDETINMFLCKGRLVFLPRDLDETAQRLNLDLIIRSQSVCERGFSLLTDHVMSVYSAHYSGATASAGLYIDGYGVISITRLFCSGHFNSVQESPALDILEKTAERALERAENVRRGEENLDGLHLREPVKERMTLKA
ncbi:hypothetical protein PFISCL1PPCAC_4817, partial [Pristionchus fissidentatus]